MSYLTVDNSKFSQTNQVAKDGLEIDFPISHGFAADFLGYMPEKITTITIWRLIEDDGGYQVAWKGRVNGTKPVSTKVTLVCEQIFSSMKRNGLGPRCQRLCRHAHYGRGCNLSIDDWALFGAVDAIDGAIVTMPAAATKADGYYNGGMLLTNDGTFRYILTHVGVTLTLMRSIGALLQDYANHGYGNNYGNVYGGIAATIYPGCDHSTTTCKATFNNLDNYGGMPWMSGENLFSKSVF